VESLEQKRTRAEWSDQNVVKESNSIYVASGSDMPVPQCPTTPIPHEGMQYGQDS
jgi:hypothetical protein